MHDRKAVVLIVEDDAIIRLGAVSMVQSGGHVALGAGNAAAAITLLESRGDVDLVFTDVNMPGSRDGIALAHYIRDRWPPVLLIVASGAFEVGASELPSGALFFPKPYDERTLQDAITGLLRGRPCPAGTSDDCKAA